MHLFSRFRFISLTLPTLLALTLPGFGQEPPPPATPPASPAADPAVPATAPAAVAPDTPAPAVPPPEEDRANLRRIDQTDTTVEAPRHSRQHRSRGGVDGFPLGDHTVPPGRRTREVVSILGSTLVEGEVDSDVVSVGGRTTIARGARVGGAAVAVMGRLEMEGEVGDDSVSVMGASYIDGPVRGDAVSVLGNMRLGPRAVIEGDLVVVGGTLTKDPEAVVHGDQVNVPFVSGFGEMEWLLNWVKRCVFLGRPLGFGAQLGWAWTVALAFLAFYLLLALLFPRAIVRCTETLETRPGYSVLSSVLSVLLTPVALILLSITVVGALLVPFLGVALVFAKLFGKAVMLAWIGRRFTRFFGDGPLGHPVMAVLIGGLIVLLIYTVPLFGFLTFGLLTWLGFGVVIYTVSLAMKRDRPPGGPRAVGAGAPIAPVAPIEPQGGAAVATASFTPPSEPASASTFAPAGMVASPVMSAGFTGAAAPAPEVPVPPPVVPPKPAAALENPLGPTPVPPVEPVAAIPASVPPPAWSRPPAPPPPVVAATEWRRAGFFIRLAALALDGVLVGIVMAFMYGMLPRFMRHDSPGPWLIALAIYAAVMWKHKGTTIGGIVCGLKVVRVDNRELDWTTVIVRTLGCFLSLAVAGLGFVWTAIDEEKQSWHDKIAGTTVVHVPKGVSLV